MDNKQMIEKIMEEVKDTELRDKLLRAVTDEQKADSWISDHDRDYGKILNSMGLKPDAVTKNIGLAKNMYTVGCAFFVCLGAAMITWGDDLFGWLFILMSGLIYFLNRKFYDNLAD
jgi:hypothetical protein